MNNATKRLLSLVIVLAMALALLPVISFAADTTTTIYCKTSTTWTACKVHWWGSAATPDTSWPGADMTKVADGIWTIDVPADATGLVLNNGSGTQSKDQKVPTGTMNMFDFSNGAWIEYDPTPAEEAYYVAGSMNDWTNPDPAYKMIKQADGTYALTLTLAAGSYELKVTDGTWNDGCNWGAAGSNANYKFDAAEDGEYIVTFDGATVNVIGGVEPEPPVSAGYYVIGSFNNWGLMDANYLLVEDEDGVYSLTFDVTAGQIELKVNDGTWNEGCNWGNNGENIVVTAVTDGAITVTFDGTNVTVKGDCLGDPEPEPEPEPMVIETMHVVGAADLTGAEWDPTANPMTANGTVYTITFENIAAGTYEFKFAANGTWDLNWASGIEMPSGESQTTWFNAQGNSTIVVAEDNSTVTLTIDITNMDLLTGENAVSCAVIEAPAAGVTVSGTATTGAEGDTTIELIAEGEVVATATASGKEAAYSIENVAAGTYTLKVSKLNHVTREYTVTVEAEALTQDVKIHLIGDIDGSGRVNAGDVAKLSAHLKGTNVLTDEYMILCANVNGGSLNMGDTATLYSHIKGTKVLY